MDEDEKKTVTGRIAHTMPDVQYLGRGMLAVGSASIAAAIATMDFSQLENRVMLDYPDGFGEGGDFLSYMTGGSRRSPGMVVGRTFSYEKPPPKPNPKADKRKANRVKQMQERRARRRAMGGKNVPR